MAGESVALLARQQWLGGSELPIMYRMGEHYGALATGTAGPAIGIRPGALLGKPASGTRTAGHPAVIPVTHNPHDTATEIFDLPCEACRKIKQARASDVLHNERSNKEVRR